MTSLYAAALDPVTLAVPSGKVNECWCCPGGTAGRSSMNKAQGVLAALSAVLKLTGSGCGGGYGSIFPPPPPSYTLGGTVKGLAGDGLVLQNNGANGATIGRAA